MFGMNLEELKEKFSREELIEAFSRLSEAEAEALLSDWTFIGRRNQQPPEDNDWRIWLLLAGRGLV